MRIFRSSLVPLACLALLVPGCDDDDYGSPQTCRLACERAAECDGTPAARCAMACRDPGAPAPRLSERYLDAVRRCLDAQTCDVMFNGVEQSCAEQEALRLKPSKPAEMLCRRADDDAYDCGRTMDPATCLADVKIFDDASLRRALSCYDGPCNRHAECVRDWFGYYAVGTY